jgi:uroporphyrinogen decarboxylase
MTHLERFLATIERRSVDRPASWLGLPHPDALPALYAHFGVSNEDELKFKIDDDVYAVNMPFHSPFSDHISTAVNFAKIQL